MIKIYDIVTIEIQLPFELILIRVVYTIDLLYFYQAKFDLFGIRFRTLHFRAFRFTEPIFTLGHTMVLATTISGPPLLYLIAVNGIVIGTHSLPLPLLVPLEYLVVDIIDALDILG